MGNEKSNQKNDSSLLGQGNSENKDISTKDIRDIRTSSVLVRQRIRDKQREEALRKALEDCICGCLRDCGVEICLELFGKLRDIRRS